MGGRRNKLEERRIAMRRMDQLMRQATTAPSADAVLSRRYVALARRIGMRYQVALPRHWRRRVCRGCGAALVAGRNGRVRMRQGRIVVTCLDCGRVARYGTGPRGSAP